MNGQTQLYLILEVDGEMPDPAAALAQVLCAAAFASALLRPAAGALLDARTVAPLITGLQRRGVAALIADDPALARATKADGVHLSWSKDIVKRYCESRGALGPAAIVGADAGRSRHDAMELGEAGADYIAFGIPPHVEDRATAEHRQNELVAWWSEIFVPPVVAFDVAGTARASALADSGADFVGVALSLSAPAADNAKVVLSFAQAVDMSRVPA